MFALVRREKGEVKRERRIQSCACVAMVSSGTNCWPDMTGAVCVVGSWHKLPCSSTSMSTITRPRTTRPTTRSAPAPRSTGCGNFRLPFAPAPCGSYQHKYLCMCAERISEDHRARVPVAVLRAASQCWHRQGEACAGERELTGWSGTHTSCVCIFGMVLAGGLILPQRPDLLLLPHELQPCYLQGQGG